MGDLSGVKVGDELLLIESYNRYRPEPRVVTVEKVGRKLIHADARTYRISDGVRNDGYGHSLLRTREEHAEIQERAELLSTLRDLGVTFDRFGASAEVATAKLRRLLALWAAADEDL